MAFLGQILAEADADSGVDETTQNGSPTKPPTTSGSGGSTSRIPKKTPPSTPAKAAGSRSRNAGQRQSGQRPPVRSKSVPKPFTSYSLTPVSSDEIDPPIKKGLLAFLKITRGDFRYIELSIYFRK
jgi:hypothetical protein